MGKKQFGEVAVDMAFRPTKRQRIETIEKSKHGLDKESVDKRFQYYEEMKATCQQHDKQRRQDHDKMVKQVQELRCVYLYGLQQVSALED